MPQPRAQTAAMDGSCATSSAADLPLKPAPELPSECVEHILWFVSRETEGDPRVIRTLSQISKSWKRAADREATYAAMLLHRYGIANLALPFTRHRVDWGLNGGTLNRAPNREFAPVDPANIENHDETRERARFERSDVDFAEFDYRTPTDVWTAEEMRAELRRAGYPENVPFDEWRTERFVPSPSSAAAMLARRNARAPDARACFLEWHEDYGDAEPRLFRRMHEAWAIVEKAFATQGMESVWSTILPGETKERCDAFARYWHVSGQNPARQMHPSLALLYRLRGGQMVYSIHAQVCGAGGFPFGPPDAFDALSCRRGVLGGFSAYDDNRCTALLSFDHAVVWARRFRLHKHEAFTDVSSLDEMGRMWMRDTFRLAPIAGSWYDSEWNPLCADVAKGTVHAHIPPLDNEDGPNHPWAPPTAHPKKRFGVAYDACDWFVEYASRVSDGMYRVADDIEPFPTVSVIPGIGHMDAVLRGPMMWRIPRSSFQGRSMDAHETTLYEHVSHGALRVTVGVVHAGIQAIDESWTLNRSPAGSDHFVYEVTFSLLSEDEQRRRFAESGLAGSSTFTPLRRVRLERRRWVIKEGVEVFGERWFSEQQQVVEGRGVIGLHPELSAGGESFSYRSMTDTSRNISPRVILEFEHASKRRADLRKRTDLRMTLQQDGKATASMSGAFTFSTDAPGAELEATCPEFFLQTPAYVFG